MLAQRLMDVACLRTLTILPCRFGPNTSDRGLQMGCFARRSALVAAGMLALAGCRIEVLLEFDQPLPNDPRPATSWRADDVEALPGDGFIGAGCLFDVGAPATGVVAFDADANVERVLSSCSSVEEGSLGAATTADGTVYFVRSREILPFEEYVFELVRVPAGGDESDGVVVHSQTTGPEGMGGTSPFENPVVSPDGSIVLVQSNYEQFPPEGVFTVTGPTTRVLRPGTADLTSTGFEVRTDGTIIAAKGNQVVSISPTGAQTVLAGTGVAGFSGDGGPATAATLNNVRDVAQGTPGVIFVADYGNDRVRRIGPGGNIQTVAGGGTEDPADGGLARNAHADGPWKIAYDGTERGVGPELWVVEGDTNDLLYLGIR